jgi:hypothetical protein
MNRDPFHIETDERLLEIATSHHLILDGNAETIRILLSKISPGVAFPILGGAHSGFLPNTYELDEWMLYKLWTDDRAVSQILVSIDNLGYDDCISFAIPAGLAKSVFDSLLPLFCELGEDRTKMRLLLNEITTIAGWSLEGLRESECKLLTINPDMFALAQIETYAQNLGFHRLGKMSPSGTADWLTL